MWCWAASCLLHLTMSPTLQYIAPEIQLTRTWNMLLVDQSFKLQMSICLWNYQEIFKYLLRLWNIMPMPYNVARSCFVVVVLFFFFLNVVRAEGKVLWAGIQLAHITRYVIYFATAATEKHDITPSLSSAVQSVWPLSAAVVGCESAGKLLQGDGHRW